MYQQLQNIVEYIKNTLPLHHMASDFYVVPNMC